MEANVVWLPTSSFVFCRRKKLVQVWKEWRNFYFGVTVPLTKSVARLLKTDA